MIKYFKKIRDTLVDDGIFFSDAYGGYEAFQELKEKQKMMVSPISGTNINTTL